MIVRGARVVTPGRDLGVADVRIENGVIAEVAAKVSPTAGERVIEAGYNQLRSLGILGRGEIAAGQIADLVLVDESLSPCMTIVGGEVMRS